MLSKADLYIFEYFTWANISCINSWKRRIENGYLYNDSQLSLGERLNEREVTIINDIKEIIITIEL